MPWEVSASHVIKENLTHPAIVMVVTEFDELLSEAAHRAALNPTPNRQDWSGKTYRELARLHRRGVTGRDVFRIVAGVHFYARALPPNSKAHQFTLARHVLNFTWRERFGGWCERKNFTGWRDRKDTVRLSTRVLENLGRHLAVSTAGVLHAMEPAFDQRLSAPAERRERLSTALEQPFTNSPPNTHERNSPSAILERCPALS